MNSEVQGHERGRLGETSLPEKRIRKWLHHETPGWVRNGVFFVTMNCRQRGQNQLCCDPVALILRDAVAFYHAKYWWAHLWLMMPDHVHSLISFPESVAMNKVVSSWKRYVARASGVQWQKGFLTTGCGVPRGFRKRLLIFG